ncbi:MAG: histidine--tRNA ligase [Zoogloeaceae bacterium]|jgi:histidyl-tRNA synthetase|nr:histidine--tRNA ligase [Zoogloeaceae bacterium]
MSQKLQSVRGMNDILPAEALRWEWLEARVAGCLRRYGYLPIQTPIVEPTPLFSRAIGEATDIVEKEMYSFSDALNGESLTLRPEGTAGCARAVIQHGLANQHALRLYYMGAMFRHERPQKGRYRQFHQIGAEAFGFPGPDVDAEQILLLARLWKELGLSLTLTLNSLGQPEERAQHRKDLIAYLEKHEASLDEDARRRLYSNPLRIFDSKDPTTQAVCAKAPELTAYLGEASRAHFAGVIRILGDEGIPFTLNPRLVRGLDYYNLTVFEWITTDLGAQGTVAAGGRYDGLVAQLGGKPTPACGFAIGLERLLELVAQNEAAEHAAPDVYIVHQGEGAGERTTRLAFRAAERLRDAGSRVVLHCGGGSFKSQMKKADASGANYAILIGEEEAGAESVLVKPLRERAREQTLVPLASLTRFFSNDFA